MSANEVNLTGTIRCRRPQEQWKWPIAVSLFLAGMGAGAFIIGLLADWLLHPALPTRAILLWGPLFVAAGAPFLILDLGRKRRFINACRNPKSSWAARGFLILSTFIIIGISIFGISVFPVLGLTDQSTLFVVLKGVALVFAFGTAIYTGMFLKSVRYITLWNSSLLPVLFTVSALSIGSMGIVLVTMGYGLLVPNEYATQLSHTLMPVQQALVLMEALVLAVYLYERYRTKEAGETSVRLLLSGEFKFVFWVGIVASGFVVPIALEKVYSMFPGYPALLFAAGLIFLLGGFFLRFGILSAGVKEQHPLYKMIALEYDWAALKKHADSIPQSRLGRSL